MAELKIEKFRDLNDFVLNSARFQVPQMNSWGRRLKANLIYYQTNYFGVFAVLFLLMGIVRPQQVLIGLLATAALGFLINYLSERPGATERIRQDYPSLCLLAILAILYFVLGYYFILAVLLPLLVVIFHASLRLRNVGNKVANLADKVGLKKTPMGILLDEFHFVLDALDE